MKLRLFLAVQVVLAARVLAQQPATTSQAPALPKDPRAILEAARPHYDFADPKLKPWHLKASYQLYDPDGKATVQGSWEYWWAAPTVHRSTVVRQDASHSEWETRNGSIYRRESSAPLKYFERNLDTILLYNFPSTSAPNAGKTKLGLKMIGKETACVTSTFQPEGPLSLPQYYCFDSATLALINTFSNSVESQYSQFAKIGDHYFPRHITVRVEKQIALTISIESIDGIDPADAALIIPSDAVAVHGAARHDTQGAAVSDMNGSLAKKSFPVYPQSAKSQRIQGVVVLGVTIGADGKVSNVELLASPSPLLTESAVDSVKKWEYHPYLIDGQSVEVETVVNVIYTISG